MNIQLLFEDGKGSVIDKYGRPEPMDYTIDEEQFRLETLSSPTQYFAQFPLESENKVEIMQMKKETKARQSEVFQTTTKQLGIHIRTAQKWSKQYEKDSDSIFEKHKNFYSRMHRLESFSRPRRTRLQPIDRNSDEKILGRLDLGSVAWSQKGTSAVVTAPKRRATTTILGAISAEGLIKCSLRFPQSSSNKKRKWGDGVEHMSKGTVTGYYVSFLKATMDEMGYYPHIKGHYLMKDSSYPYIKVHSQIRRISRLRLRLLVSLFSWTQLNRAISVSGKK
ncbi:hypothetical protein PHYBLDRAFT_139244 [Phycomyces blakesleeanus NRRL 1555(-)]|uniref:Homeodomain-like DNA binding domain-containing transcription factor n=1 Tax=Phycomyces blakesleeanus (strain ATCC 8743b / DSM 1359 / FGSC 10004 / NBRC 33097 / NRRL 1555) TaxID=763407 RepID=A0A167Q7F2_PHYB8|nr:hypothetical protein PHYBLDRAFT_139244 [Phycomyces blakesleeanus NRRL 1555(-)]OAD79209.1 hypothetical protein PHYBLDRAFT_139244 [Phycomyces blakesleeanus NRRL 1555(-)]|eukprot:XP_018297249.1 hypothetical protein PHYBLDRAFT_139244 [Phycomyces blakesleeanus NRRL 1555(-)]